MTHKLSLFLLFLLIPINAFTQELYISPYGNDNSDGLSPEQRPENSTGPFQTIVRAQQAIRDIKNSNKFKEPITIHVQAGTYQLNEAIKFNSSDSGTPDKIIHWQAENGMAVVSGAKNITKCSTENNNVWSCPIDGLDLSSINYQQNPRKQGNIPGFELFVNDDRLHLARWPNSDWAHIKLPLDRATSFSSIEELPNLSEGLNNAQVHIFAGNDWFDQYIAVSKLESNHLTLAAETKYPLASGRRFYLQNVRTELDAPGEWFYDVNNKNILFIPPINTHPSDINISSLKNLLILDQASHISFSNFSFKYSTDTAVSIDKSSNVALNNIEVNNIGGLGISVKQSQYVTILNSQIHHTGNGGVLLSGGDRNLLRPAHNSIHNSYIHDFGVILMNYSPAITLDGVGSMATNNLVEQGAGLGIQINGNDHLIEKNEINHVCEQASDCGAIYSGRDWTYRGNIIRYNSIHDLFGYGLIRVDLSKNIVTYAKSDGVRGIYLDDAVSGFDVTGNIFKNTGAIAIHIGGGRDNTIYNNIIYTSGYAISIDDRWPKYNWGDNKNRLLAVPNKSKIWAYKYPELSLKMNNYMWPEGNKINNNIIISTNPKRLALRYYLPSKSNLITKNLVWSDSGQIAVDYNILDIPNKKRGAAPWDAWISEGLEKNSIYADPCITISGNKSTFCANTPASKIEFQALPEDIGLIK
ncbi:right-handed parallel beta-helix repeat-containing protein [Methylomonas fluvii]|uniref:Right-handed parallel beta-helix repeat-containing protein n=1 Tax=Methylomonas fluvii TaxID=1854564 RepID=A0ABR9D9U6_9GAMM|nr:right-handed parallel beta-helix repeat-containing protein [Methylomonas fluvii]MBD9359877.1 right-handed parallel beta-helix repeat-containing protein [Methylomonas fluvii]CAD6872645.1 hypothetical protein [Methylomonas fluvii]